MASGVPSRQEGIVPIPAAPLAFRPSAGGGPTGICHLPSPVQPLCVRLPNHRPRHDLLRSDTYQSRLHPQMRISDVVAPLNRTPKILDVTLDTHFTFGPHARNCVERALWALNVMKALAGSSWGFTTESPKPWCPRIRSLCAPSSTMLPPSGSPKYPPPIWTNLRWYRTKPWGLRLEAIERSRRPTSIPAPFTPVT